MYEDLPCSAKHSASITWYPELQLTSIRGGDPSSPTRTAQRKPRTGTCGRTGVARWHWDRRCKRRLAGPADLQLDRKVALRRRFEGHHQTPHSLHSSHAACSAAAAPFFLPSMSSAEGFVS